VVAAHVEYVQLSVLLQGVADCTRADVAYFDVLHVETFESAVEAEAD